MEPGSREGVFAVADIAKAGARQARRSFLQGDLPAAELWATAKEDVST
jgi:hypothetical protein